MHKRLFSKLIPIPVSVRKVSKQNKPQKKSHQKSTNSQMLRTLVFFTVLIIHAHNINVHFVFVNKSESRYLSIQKNELSKVH